MIIDLSANGLPACVETTRKAVKKCLKTIEKRKASAKYCQQTADMLKRQFFNHVADIQKYGEYHDGFELMTRQKFDDDLVWIAVYDKVGRNIDIKEVA